MDFFLRVGNQVIQIGAIDVIDLEVPLQEGGTGARVTLRSGKEIFFTGEGVEILRRHFTRSSNEALGDALLGTRQREWLIDYGTYGGVL